MLVERVLAQARERLISMQDGAPVIDAAKLLRVDTDIVVICNAVGTLVGLLPKRMSSIRSASARAQVV